MASRTYRKPYKHILPPNCIGVLRMMYLGLGPWHKQVQRVAWSTSVFERCWYWIQMSTVLRPSSSIVKNIHKMWVRPVCLHGLISQKYKNPYTITALSPQFKCSMGSTCYLAPCTAVLLRNITRSTRRYTAAGKVDRAGLHQLWS